MKNLKGTEVVVVSQEYWIKDNTEKRNAKRIVELEGECHGIDCYDCPLHCIYHECEQELDVRVDICRKMLGL